MTVSKPVSTRIVLTSCTASGFVKSTAVEKQVMRPETTINEICVPLVLLARAHLEVVESLSDAYG